MIQPTLNEKLNSANMLVWYYCRRCKRCHYQGSKIFTKHLRGDTMKLEKLIARKQRLMERFDKILTPTEADGVEDELREVEYAIESK